MITTIIIKELNSKDAQKRMKDDIKELPEEDQERFISSVKTELMAIHEGNFARYRVSQKEFINWQKIWNS